MLTRVRGSRERWPGGGVGRKQLFTRCLSSRYIIGWSSARRQRPAHRAPPRARDGESEGRESRERTERAEGVGRAEEVFTVGCRHLGGWREEAGETGCTAPGLLLAGAAGRQSHQWAAALGSRGERHQSKAQAGTTENERGVGPF